MESSNTIQSVARTPGKRPVAGIVIGIIVFALVAGYLFGGRGGSDTGKTSSPASAPGQFTKVPAAAPSSGARDASRVTADDPAWGPPGASVTVVEFSDFECPYCREAYPTVRALMRQYGDRVLFQYRDFPISDIHPDAQKAAEAAACAHAQGKFWDYHDLLFQNQEDLSREALTRYALTVNADIAAFNRCLDGGLKAQEVSDDLQDGIAADIAGTPTFFINGVKYEGVLAEEEFTEIIEALL